MASMRTQLYIRTFKGDWEVGEAVPVKAKAVDEMMDLMYSRSTSETYEVVPNLVIVEEKDGTGAYGGRVHFIFAVGKMAEKLADASGEER